MSLKYCEITYENGTNDFAIAEDMQTLIDYYYIGKVCPAAFGRTKIKSVKEVDRARVPQLQYNNER